ncbi:ribbon-helix-helix domain-containing protein [Bacillus thuringiensis]
MSENRGLKTRKALSNAVRIDLYEQLKKLSNETKIPMSKLLDEAIEELIIKRKSTSN